jgi:hypothetical protein
MIRLVLHENVSLPYPTHRRKSSRPIPRSTDCATREGFLLSHNFIIYLSCCDTLRVLSLEKSKTS